MSAELAFVDWVALVVAAVLLAGAAAAMVIVTVAANQKRRSNNSSPYSGPKELRAGPQPRVTRSTSPNAQVIDLRSQRRSSGVTRAARADRLRQIRPVPDTPPPVPRTANASVLTLDVARIERHERAGFSPRQPGFFEDPVGRHEQRYWDGERWTEHVKEAGHRFTDPL